MRAVVAVVLLVPAIAGAEPAFVPAKAVVVGRVGDGAWTDAATEARLDQRAELAAVVIGKRGGTRVVLAPASIASVQLGGSRIRTEPLDPTAKIQWSTVEPHGFRTTPAKNGVTSDFYSNVSVEPPSFGAWRGYDAIDYFEHVARPWSATAIIPATVAASEANATQVPGLGTIRFKVEVELSGVRVASPGSDTVDTAGILPAVHRVSIRRGDDFLGRLSGYLLVPEVFGSAGAGRSHQTDRFTGADCADVMVGAMRRMGKQLAYTNVAGLIGYARPVSKQVVLDDRGNPPVPVRVAVGDLIRIDYGADSPRPSWDHVAALWEDRSDPAGPAKGGPDGLLDGFDLVIHMGHPRLVIEPLARQAPATIDVLRWR